MAELFISYKSEDRARVKPLVDALTADGLSVWWDAHIGAGDDWRLSIERNLDAAKVVIVVWSQSSVGPDGRFVRDEATRAQRRGAYLPVRIDQVDPPLGFGEIQAQPLEGWKGGRKDPRYQAVVQAARAMLENGQDSPTPAPAAPPAARALDRRLLLAGGGVAAVAAVGAGTYVLWPRPATAQTLAVLPFANMSDNAAQAYFVDGLAEELRNSLTLVPQFRVVARTSSEAVRNEDVRQAAAKLGVSSIVTGSVRRSSGAIRISAQLIDGANGVERWSQTYDRPEGDVLEVQSAIAMNIAQALQVRLAANALEVGGTRNIEAHDLLLKANELSDQGFSAPISQQILALTDRAIALDPDYAQAWALRSGMQMNLSNTVTTVDGVERAQRDALASAKKAISLAPTLVLAYTAAGYALENLLELGASRAMFERALAVGPNDPRALRITASSLARTGRAADALVLLDRAIALDPLNNRNPSARLVVLFRARRYQEGLDSARLSIARMPGRDSAHELAGHCLLMLGRLPEALAEYRALPEDYRRLTGEAIVQWRLGDGAASSALLARLQALNGDTAHYQGAQVHAQRGEKPEALSELEKAWTSATPGWRPWPAIPSSILCAVRRGSRPSPPSWALRPEPRPPQEDETTRGRDAMDMGLKDKVVFIAGASRGIGLGIVEACLAEGAKVALTARGAEALEATRKRLTDRYGADKLWALAGDMRESAFIDRSVAEAEAALGPIWGAVANVGLHPCPPGFDVDDETWAAGVHQNLTSAQRLSRAVLGRMVPRGEGSLILITSIAGLGALGTPLTYGTSKAAMNHLAQELAKIAGPKGVRVNAIAPGNIIFPGGEWEERSTGARADNWWRWVKREVPLQRFGTPEEIGAAAAFLLSPRASFVHGAVLPVDGGQTR